MLVALKQACANLCLKFNEFELGYIIFCLSNICYLDISIFHYYRKIENISLIKLVQPLITKIHYSLMLSLLEEYLSCVRYVCSGSFMKTYKVNDLLFNIERGLIDQYDYCLCLNLQNSINSLSVFILLTKILSYKGIINLFLNFFNISYFDYVISGLVVSKNFLFLEKNRFLKLVIEIFILQIHYELYTLFEYDNNIKNSLKKIITIYNFNLIIFLFENSHQRLYLKDDILYILSSFGIPLKMNRDLFKYCLLNGISTNIFLIHVQYNVYPFNLTVKPSLKYQFELMKQISFLFKKSKSSIFPLIAIRLNMLILLWSNIFIRQPVKRIFYLLDYLINLKLRNQFKYYSQTQYIFLKSDQDKVNHMQIDCTLINRRLKFFMFIYYKHYCSFYVTANLLWFYKLKC
jgi:hypothetical protein